MILYIKNISMEGPGLIGDFFAEKGHPSKTIDLERGDELPKGIDGIAGVVVLGGPMGVYEEEKYPYLACENEFIKEIISSGVPYMGLCLGAQLLAKAAGASVKRAQVEEIGYSTVELTPEAGQDALFAEVEKDLDVFQWHGDTFDIPEGGVLLAKGRDCLNQAFRVGRNAYGIQFHLEVTREIVKDWIDEYFSSGDEALKSKSDSMLEDDKRFRESLEENVKRLCKNFEKIMASAR